MRRAVALLLLTVVVPGSAQLTAGDGTTARVGRLVVRVWLGFLAAAAGLGLLWLVLRSLVLGLLTAPSVLSLIALACFAWAVLIAGLLVNAWLLGRPQTLPVRARRWLAVLTAVLVLFTGYPRSLREGGPGRPGT